MRSLLWKNFPPRPQQQLVLEFLLWGFLDQEKIDEDGSSQQGVHQWTDSAVDVCCPRQNFPRVESAPRQLELWHLRQYHQQL